MVSALKGLVLCVVEKLKTMTKKEMEAFIKKNGGEVAKSVTRKCTHVVVSDKKGKKALAAKKKGKKLLSERQVQNLAKKPAKKTKKKATTKKRKSSTKKRKSSTKKRAKKRTSKKKKRKTTKKKSTTKKRTTKKKKKTSTKRRAKKRTSKRKASTKKRTTKRKKTTKRKSSTKKRTPAKRKPAKKRASPKKKKRPALRRQLSKPAEVDVVFSFDTTGSMSGVIRQARSEIKKSAQRLFQENPELRVGVIAHGDYCDGLNLMKKLDLTDDEDAVIKFIDQEHRSGGGDAPEAYEYALHTGKQMDWREGASKAFVLIGDEVPHEPSYPMNRENLDWRKELKDFAEKGISIYSVQAYNRGDKQNKFYAKCAKDTGGFHLKLEQFTHATNMLLAICFNEQGGSAAAAAFEQELKDGGEMDAGLKAIFDVILERTGATGELTDEKLHEVSESKFEVLEVKEDCSIREFVNKHGLKFKKGRGFYQFTKRELVQEKKEVVIQDTNTGDFYSGIYARKLIGLNPGERKKVSPDDYEDYNIYIQSTSYNRKLKGGTMFLYED